MLRGLVTVAFAAVLLAVGSATANHDQGHGYSQDHLHRNSPGGSLSTAAVAVPEPSSAVMLTVGVAAVAWWVLRRRR